MVLRNIDGLEEASLIILHHHERWDGNGYPGALRAESIPLGARIIAVADSYDAMTTTRPYRQALPVSRALDELSRGRLAQFDPAAVEAFLAHMYRERSEPGRATSELAFAAGAR
jgi:HD-GYP domain-containing protein (c-di-GMP phosphodiesterase class II)